MLTVLAFIVALVAGSVAFAWVMGSPPRGYASRTKPPSRLPKVDGLAAPGARVPQCRATAEVGDG